MLLNYHSYSMTPFKNNNNNNNREKGRLYNFMSLDLFGQSIVDR